MVRTVQPIGRIVRSIGVLVCSFGLVFGVLYTIVTWPLLPQQANYYLSQLNAPPQDVAAASSVSDVTNTVATLDLSGGKSGVDTDGDGIPDTTEVRYYGTDPHKADTDADGYSDLTEVTNGFSPLKAADYQHWIAERTSAVIRIPKIQVNAPVVWNEDLARIYEDLKSGAVHYRATANPGDAGNSVLIGHSSTYVWDQNKYGTLFALLDKLKAGDKVYVDYVNTTYTYVVTGTDITDPTDTRHFAPSGEPIVTLVSCWPAGQNGKRIFVTAKLVTTAPVDPASHP